jgi:outer membrane protein assembly factor BamB
VARLRIVTSPGEAAYLALEATANEVAFLSPGSPVVTSDADGTGALVWVLDANLRRSDPLVGPRVPHPVLYAFDAESLRLLWRSSPDQLQVGGKYNTPAIAGGVVYVGTDRVQALGLGTDHP